MSTPEDLLKKLQDILGHEFENSSLLEEALTHPSTDAHAKDEHSNYERLEFLGDRVLGLVVAEMLLKNFPEEREGDIAKRHTGLVQTDALAEIAKKIELGGFLSLSVGEQKSGGRKKKAVLADAMEAVLGALYLDGGLQPPKDFIHKHWHNTMQSYDIPPMDAKTKLQEWAQRHGLPLPQYVLLERSGPDHAPVFDMEVRVKGHPSHSGTSNSKQSAQKHAAQNMLNYLSTLDDKNEQ